MDSKIPQTIKEVMTITAVINFLLRLNDCFVFSPIFIPVLYYGISPGTSFLDALMIK